VKRKAPSEKTKSLPSFDEDEDEDEDDHEEGGEKLAVGYPPSRDGIRKNSKADEGPEEQDLGCAPTKHKSESSQVKKTRLEISTQDVDNTFLPDRDRAEEERGLRDISASEWRERHQGPRKEETEITFSYWDDSKHRRTVNMKKGKGRNINFFRPAQTYCGKTSESYDRFQRIS